MDFNVVRYIVRDMRMRYVCHCACEELQKLLSSVVLETSNHPEAESDSQRVCHESDARHSIAEKMDMNGYWMKWQEEAKYIEMICSCMCLSDAQRCFCTSVTWNCYLYGFHGSRTVAFGTNRIRARCCWHFHHCQSICEEASIMSRRQFLNVKNGY